VEVMDADPLTLLLEGYSEAAIVRGLFRAAGIASRSVVLQPLQGKANVKRFAHSLPERLRRSHIALVDLDAQFVPDAVELAREQLGDPPIAVCCAVPEMEAWLFADDKWAREQARSPRAEELLERLPLPEEIPHPKHLSSQVFPRPIAEDAFASMNIERAEARSPSLHMFLTAIRSALGLPIVEPSEPAARSMSRDLFANLVREVSPAETILWRTSAGCEFTAKELLIEIEKGSDLGLQYASDMLRLCRDLLARKVQRERAR
jgi:hypothetical protein